MQLPLLIIGLLLGYIKSVVTIKTTFKTLPLRKPRRRWEDNIRIGLEEIGINARNWVDWAQDRNYWRALS